MTSFLEKHKWFDYLLSAVMILGFLVIVVLFLTNRPEVGPQFAGI